MSSLTDVAGIAPAYQSSYTVTQGTTSQSISVIGVTEDYATVHNYDLASGRLIAAGDRSKVKQVAVLGATAASDFFDFFLTAMVLAPEDDRTV